MRTNPRKQKFRIFYGGDKSAIVKGDSSADIAKRYSHLDLEQIEVLSNPTLRKLHERYTKTGRPIRIRKRKHAGFLPREEVKENIRFIPVRSESNLTRLINITKNSLAIKKEAGWARDVGAGFVREDIENATLFYGNHGEHLVVFQFTWGKQTVPMEELNLRETEELLDWASMELERKNPVGSIKVKNYLLTEDEYSELNRRAWGSHAPVGHQISDEEIESIIALFRGEGGIEESKIKKNPAQFEHERLRTPKRGAHYRTIVRDGHRIVIEVPRVPYSAPSRAQAILHPIRERQNPYTPELGDLADGAFFKFKGKKWEMIRYLHDDLELKKELAPESSMGQWYDMVKDAVEDAITIHGRIKRNPRKPSKYNKLVGKFIKQGNTFLQAVKKAKRELKHGRS